VNRDNVVPFISAARAALARRGAPDKARTRSAPVEFECPRCAAVLRLDAGVLAMNPEILCAACDASFFLLRGEAAAD
jgi:hypothetical protein